MSDVTGRLVIPARGRDTRLRIVQLVCTAVYVLGALIFAVIHFTWSFAVPLLLAALFTINYWARWRPTYVDQDGIRRQGLFRATPWTEIAALIEPGRWDPTVHLRSTKGKDLPTGVPAGYLDQLATLSGKPIEARPSSRARSHGRTSPER